MRKRRNIAYPFIILILFFSTIKIYSQNYDLWGVTKDGGKYSGGTIFKLDSNGRHFNNVHDFYRINAYDPGYTHLCEVGSGKFFGMTTRGGEYRNGVIFSYDTLIDTLIIVHNFNYQSTGSNPVGSLFLASDGWLYGMAESGGSRSGGTFFKLNPNNDTFVLLREFSYNDTVYGNRPWGSLIKASNGKLYGLNISGGKNGNGTIFEYNISTDSFLVIHHFERSKGAGPVGELIQAKNGNFYGVTYSGGIYGRGTIFEYNLKTDSFNSLFSFQDSIGAYTHASLVEADSGKLYGVTTTGGENWDGVLYEYNIITDKYRKILDFDDRINGKNPYSKLLYASNGILYGLCERGGINGGGVLFQYSPEFDSFSVNIHLSYNGSVIRPQGSLIESSNGKLYGINYSYEISTNRLTQLFAFGGGSINGLYPNSPLVISPDGKLYGTTSRGGLNSDWGILYSFDTINNVFKNCFDYPYQKYNNQNNNLLIDTNGIIASIYDDLIPGGNPNYSSYYDEYFYFYNPKIDSIINSYYPRFSYYMGDNFGRDFIYGADGLIYGVATTGGKNNKGVLFKYNLQLDTLIVIHNFNGANGAYPVGGVEQASNGNLYGITSGGGANDDGVIYEYDLKRNKYNVFIDLNGTKTGTYPTGKMVLANNGKFYGMMQGGGKNDRGTIYEYDLSKNKLNVLYHFDFMNREPIGNILLAPNNKLYGFINSYGEYIFEYDLKKDSFARVHQFNYDNGYNPVGNLIIFDKCIYHFDTVSITTCDTFYSPGGKILTSSQTFNETLKNIYGCDSVVTINLTLNKSELVKFDTIVCDSFISPAGRILTNSGFYIDSFKNYRTCDSLISFNLTVNKKSKVILEKMACDSFQMPSGEAKYASGYYIDTISGYFSCDSVVEVQLEIRSSSLTQLNYSACDSLQTPFGTFKRSGNYQYFFKRWNTCDSIISLDVKVNKPKYSYFELDACDSFISPTGKTWKSSGIYKDTIKTYLACDSFITFDLSLGKTNFSNNSESACTEFISPSGKVLDQSGIYFDTISNSMSCDSIIRLDLKITKIDTGITSHGNTLLSAETNASFQWLDCLDGFIAINGETDSVFVAQKNGSYALEIQKNGCLDTTYCYTISGIGIFEEDLNNIIKVYPNPTNGKVILEIDGNAKSAEIVITDMYGKVVDKKYFDVLNKREIEIPGSKGIYFIKVLVDNDVFGVVKIVKR